VTASPTGVLASQRVQFNQSFNEVTARSSTAAANALWFGWFDVTSDPGFASDNVHVINPGGGTANVTVGIPGCGPQPATLGPATQQAFGCAAGIGGPVTVTSTGAPVLASQRVKYYQSFNEVSAQPTPPAGATSLYFPWFDRVSDIGFGNDNVHVVNTTGGEASATVNIPGCGPQLKLIPAGKEQIYSCASTGGPVTVTASVAMVAFQRVQYYRSFNEVAASP
jgi:Ni,Fe-hydrogenase III small subunit